MNIMVRLTRISRTGGRGNNPIWAKHGQHHLRKLQPGHGRLAVGLEEQIYLIHYYPKLLLELCEAVKVLIKSFEGCIPICTG